MREGSHAGGIPCERDSVPEGSRVGGILCGRDPVQEWSPAGDMKLWKSIKNPCFRFVLNDSGINPARVGWWARQHHGLLKLSGRQFFSNFENSKLIGVVLRADFRQKPGPKWKLATSRGYSSQTGGLREKSFQILNHLSWVNNVYILVWIRALSL